MKSAGLLTRRPEPDGTSNGVVVSAASSVPKPVVMVIGLGYEIDTLRVTLHAHKRWLEAGLPVFSTPEAAVKAVGKLMRYLKNRALDH